VGYFAHGGSCLWGGMVGATVHHAEAGWQGACAGRLGVARGGDFSGLHPHRGACKFKRVWVGFYLWRQPSGISSPTAT
jgi:hypothetical protein